MFVLRFLIASPRKLSPHIFCHKDYRGQRTKQDDFHPQFNTYVCQPKGTQTSYDVMLELMQSAAAHQSAQQLFTVVELFDPETHARMKLKGDEIILRPSDLQAAQEALNATTTAPSAPSLLDMDADKILDGMTVISRYKDLPEGGRLVVEGVCGKGIPPEIETEIDELQKLHPEAIIAPGLDKVSILKPVPSQISDPKSEIDSTLTRAPNVELRPGVSPSDQPEKTPAPSETKNSEPSTENKQLAVLQRVQAEIRENGKAQATTLATTLGVPAADIKAAVAQEGSGLQNKGGWISLIPIEN